MTSANKSPAKFVVFFHNATKSYTRWCAVFTGDVPAYLAAQHQTAMDRSYTNPADAMLHIAHFLAGYDLPVVERRESNSVMFGIDRRR
jgi:hypothetical protein